MQREKRLTHAGVGKIDEKDFIEAAFAEHFWRKRGNIVGSSSEENAGFAVLHPSEQRGEKALRETGVSVAGRTGRGERLFDFVNPENDGGHFLREFEALAEFLFAFADEFVVESAGIEASEFETPFAGDSFCGEAFAAALHAGN